MDNVVHHPARSVIHSPGLPNPRLLVESRLSTRCKVNLPSYEPLVDLAQNFDRKDLEIIRCLREVEVQENLL